MEGPNESRIYWANAMFNAADRAFNAASVQVLRAEGYAVFLPQESPVNSTAVESAPSAADVFRVDTHQITASSALVACLDQETVDAGVACEIGIAFAHGIPVVGLYTDVRQHRAGRGRMYKNLYVLGAVEAVGEIVGTVEELAGAIERVLRSPAIAADRVASHFDAIAPRYAEFVRRLESWYSPPWSAGRAVVDGLAPRQPRRLLDFGCGTADLTRYLGERLPGLAYFGYDQAPEMIRSAAARHAGAGREFSASWAVAEARARQEPFDAAVVAFALHDQARPADAVRAVSNCLGSGAALVLVDLTRWDLPRLTARLRGRLARPLGAVDRRLDAEAVNDLARVADMTVASCTLHLPTVSFPSAAALAEFVDVFGIDRGMDLPLGLPSNDAASDRRLVRAVLDEQAFPFSDQRAFMTCVMVKK